MAYSVPIKEMELQLQAQLEERMRLMEELSRSPQMKEEVFPYLIGFRFNYVVFRELCKDDHSLNCRMILHCNLLDEEDRKVATREPFSEVGSKTIAETWKWLQDLQANPGPDVAKVGPALYRAFLDHATRALQLHNAQLYQAMDQWDNCNQET